MPLGTSFGSEEHQRKQNALSVTRNIQRAYTCTGGRIQPIRVVPTGKRFAYLFRIIQYVVNIELSENAKLSLLLYTPNTINLCSLGGQRVNHYSHIQADTIQSKATLNSEFRNSEFRILRCACYCSKSVIFLEQSYYNYNLISTLSLIFILSAPTVQS